MLMHFLFVQKIIIFAFDRLRQCGLFVQIYENLTNYLIFNMQVILQR